jgi:hypothetical protein
MTSYNFIAIIRFSDVIEPNLTYTFRWIKIIHHQVLEVDCSGSEDAPASEDWGLLSFSVLVLGANFVGRKTFPKLHLQRQVTVENCSLVWVGKYEYFPELL